jgi:ABC-type uncharacterized transport system permease subunit
MQTVLIVFWIILPVIYALTGLFYWQYFLRSKISPGTVDRLLLASLILHSMLFIFMGIHFQRLPVATINEGGLFCAWLIAVSQFASQKVSRTRQLGVFILIPVFLLVLISTMTLDLDAPLSAKYRGSFFATHILFSLGSYACYTVAAMVAAIYLILYRKLKNKQFDVFFKKLPSLKKLERLVLWWMMAGCLFMAASSISGWQWVYRRLEPHTMSIQESLIFFVLALYICVLLSRSFLKLRGPRFALGSILGFGVLLITQIFNFHGFGT